jgi:tetratricopeptide (TPR) repeat protein
MIGGSRCIAAVLASCLVVSPVLADPKPVADKDKQVASDLVKKAIARSQAGDHSAAIDIYLQAYTIVPNSILLSNIGSEFEKSGKPEEALHYFCLYLEKEPNGTNVVYATSQAKQLQAMLGNKHVTDDNMCDPAKPKRPAKRPDPDDPGDAPDERDAPAKPKTKPAPVETAEAGDPGLRHVGIGVGLAGVVLVGVGIYAGVQAQDISDQISKQNIHNMWPAGIRDLQSRGQNYEYLQIGALAAGAAALGVGIYLYVRGTGNDEATESDPAKAKDKADRERTVHLTPTTNGVAVFGKF